MKKAFLVGVFLLLISLPAFGAQVIVGGHDSYSNNPWCVS